MPIFIGYKSLFKFSWRS